MTSSTEWYNSLRFRWIVLPVLAHILSWMTGIFGYILFPVLVTIAQYLLFKIHPAVNRAAPWFFALPITFFIWVKWGPLATETRSHDILPGVIAYYMGQLLNTLFIPLIARPDRRIILLNWLLSNIGALTVWVILYHTLLWLIPDWKVTHNFSSTSLFIVYPTIALIANSVSSFFWSNKLITDYEP